MRPIFFTFLILFVPVLLCAQDTIAPSVTNPAGIDAKVNGAFITTSIGEPAIITLQTAGGYITQGFLQPELLPCTNIELKYYPNPTKGIITIEADGCQVRVQSVQVIDIWGRPIETITSPKDNQLNLGEYAQGVYLLKVKLTNEDIHAISVVKTSN